MSAAPAVASTPASSSMTTRTSTPRRPAGESSLDVLPAELQNTIMEQKFAQIKEQRQDARNVLREAKQRTRNQQTDQQILLLVQADERLAALLSQAADSMRALLPVTPPASPDTVPLAPIDIDASSKRGAKAFEEKAQQWFSILNEVQYSLRSAVRYLREAQLSPLTPPAGVDARARGRAGSTSRGHNLSLLEVFADISGLEGATFKLPPADTRSSSSSSTRATTPTSMTFPPEASLSLQALRERQRNWKALSSSLQQIHHSMNDTTSKTPTPELSLLENIKSGCSSDRILIDALINGNGMA